MALKFRNYNLCIRDDTIQWQETYFSPYRISRYVQCEVSFTIYNFHVDKERSNSMGKCLEKCHVPLGLRLLFVNQRLS